MEPNIEALTELRRVAVEAPDELFHMRAVVENTTCGTARCLLGWMIIDPWFCAQPVLTHLIPTTYAARHLPDEYAMDILVEYLGLSMKQARKLFGDGLDIDMDPHGVPKWEVLWNLDRLIAGKKARYYRATGKRKTVPLYDPGWHTAMIGALDPVLGC
jgi:hypothetical protein